MFSCSDRPFNDSWDSWIQRWWGWAFGLTSFNSPIEDTTGELCSVNQNYPNVWFIGSTFGGKATRRCIIPLGTCIFFPALANFISFAEYPNIKTEFELTNYARTDLNTTRFANVTIDGYAHELSEDNRFITKPFAITIPADISNDVVIMRTVGVSDGYWTFLKPLSIGSHTLHIKSEKLLFDNVQHAGYRGENGMFKTEATYILSVK